MCSKVLQGIEQNNPADVPARVMAEAQRMQAYFPYRLVFAIYDGAKWEVRAGVSMAIANNAMRKGHMVFQIPKGRAPHMQ